MFSRIFKTSFYLLVFLLPLFFLPFSFEFFEFNKQYLLFFLVSLASFAFLARMVFVEKEIRFKKTPLDFFVLAFLAIAFLSFVFSVDKISGFFGFYGRFSDGLLGILSLGILYFLTTNGAALEPENHSGLVSLKTLLKIFTVSVFFVVLSGFFSIFGVWRMAGQSFFPAIMAQPIFNTTAGSMEGLAVFLAMAVVLLAGMIMAAAKDEKFSKIFQGILLVASLFLLAIINFTPAWLAISLSSVVFLVFALFKRIFRESINRLLLPIFLIIISLFFIFFDLSNQGFLTLPKEQVLSQEVSWKTAFSSATGNLKSGLLGSGAGTFYNVFTKHKPLEFNESWIWQIRFDRSGSYASEILATKGFLGILSYLLLVGMFFLMSWFLIEPKSIFSGSKFQIPILMAFLALLAGQFFYYQNTSLAFAFWLVLGLGAVSWQKPFKEKTVSFKDFPELSLVFSALAISLGIVFLVFYFFGLKFYLADFNYNKSLNILGQERAERLEKAVSLNPYFSQYRMALSRTYLFEAFREMGKPEQEQDEFKIQVLISGSINEAKKATDLQPESVACWENSAIIYRELIEIAAGAAEWSINSFEKAVSLEPTNPVLYTEMGKIYFIAGEKEKAKEYFQKALEKKPDYADALMQEALLLESEEFLEEAIGKLENLVARDSWNIDAYFQLGRLYYNSGRIDEAIELFEAVVFLAPNHSNSLYSLGLAYASKTLFDEAIEVFEKVLELNPGNQDVIQKLEELRRGEFKEAQEQEKQDEEGEDEQEGEELLPEVGL